MRARPAVVLLAALAGWLAWPSPAHAAEETPAAAIVRSGNHRGYGRLVFDFNRPVGYHLARDGSRLVIHFDSPTALPATAMPHNVQAGRFGVGQAVLRLVPGARLRTTRLGNRIVLDVLNAPRHPLARAADHPTRLPLPVPPPFAPPAAGPAPPMPVLPVPPLPPGMRPVATQPPAKPAATPDAATPDTTKPGTTNPGATKPDATKPGATSAPTPLLVPAADPVSASASPALPAPTPVSTAPATPAATDAATADSSALDPADMPDPDAPLAIAVKIIPPTQPGTAPGLELPFAPGIGAAAFRRGTDFYVVFDSARPLDLAPTHGVPAYAAAQLRLLPDATLLALPLPPGQALSLTRTDAGWLLRPVRAEPPPQIIPHPVAGTLHLPLADAGRVVTMTDPLSGGVLLVGTERGGIPPKGLSVAQRAPGFVLLPSFQGVLVAAQSDRIALHAKADGFRLTEQGGKLPITQPSAALQRLAAAAVLTRRWRFPDRSRLALRRILRRRIDTAATTPPRARFAPRLQVAKAMLALGMGVEAQGVLRVALADSPSHADDPDARGLAAIAALLAHRPDQAAGLDDPRLDGFDDVALWRAVRAASRHGGAAAQAGVFAATAPLILAYPAALRNRLLPLAADSLISAGRLAAASRLIDQRPHDPVLRFATARLAEAQGKIATALALYHHLAHGPDRLLRARARERAALLRLASGQANAARTAAALTRQLDDWRGDGRERRLRQRIAALDARAGDWRHGLAMLGRTIHLFPAHRPALRARMRAMFADMLAHAPQVSPLDLVAMADSYPDLVPDGAAGEKLAALLARRLEALDLPRRAAPVLERLMREAGDGPVRARFGAELARVRLELGDAAGAQQALADSAHGTLPAALAGQRALLAARALAKTGAVVAAAALLAPLEGFPAQHLRARLLEQAHHWPAAEQVLDALVARHVPASGALDPTAQGLLLELAGAAAQADDEDALHRLAAMAPRIPGKRGQLFRLLTAPPVSSLADLGQVSQDVALARQLPSLLQSVATPH